MIADILVQTGTGAYENPLVAGRRNYSYYAGYEWIKYRKLVYASAALICIAIASSWVINSKLSVSLRLIGRSYHVNSKPTQSRKAWSHSLCNFRVSSSEQMQREWNNWNMSNASRVEKSSGAESNRTSTVMLPMIARWCPSRVSWAILRISSSRFPRNCWQAACSISSFCPWILTC